MLLRSIGLPTSRPLVPVLVLTFVFFACMALLQRGSFSTTTISTSTPPSRKPSAGNVANGQAATPAIVELIHSTAQHFVDYPLAAPYKDKFGPLGSRLKIVRQWVDLADQLAGDEAASAQRDDIHSAIEAVVANQFGFLVKPMGNTKPLQNLRQSYSAGKGIVIPTGNGTFRYAAHLVVSLREALGCTLPIQIAYAGEDDLSEELRTALRTLAGGEKGKLEFIDLMEVLDDATMKSAKGGWATKAFAAIASTFSEVILLDADAVFVQKPEVLFEQSTYKEKGVVLYHDRLLWQHWFKERHEWFHHQIKHPGPEMEKSRVWMEEYAEEQDSGVVVIDKRRTDVLLGLLHVGWQNTEPVREEITYKIAYGDKESWWMGFELAGATYGFEKHYGSIVGWLEKYEEKDKDKKDKGKEKEKVCSFVIAHPDENDKLLWYNGGLLKNKLADPRTYETPTHWMKDGNWEKGSKVQMSCKVDGTPIGLTRLEGTILSQSIELARRVDSAYYLP